MKKQRLSTITWGVGASAAFVLLALAPAASATTITYGTPGGSTTETDNGTNFPVNATATFVTGTNSITVTLTNLDNNTFFSSQNLSGIAFSVSGFTTFSSTATSGAGTDVINPGGGSTTASSNPITENTTPTIGNSELANINPSWVLSNVGGGGTFNGLTVGSNDFVLGISAAGSGWNGVNALVGAGPYNGVNPVGSCPGAGSGGVGGNCNSGNPIVTPTSPSLGSGPGASQATEQMIYNTVTFTLSVNGVTSGTTISGPVTFMFGPDGPDQDDLVTGQVVTPEPAAFYLCGFGILAILAFRFLRLRPGFAFSAFQQSPAVVLEESFEPSANGSASGSPARRLAFWKRRLSNNS